jgi:hypothetical protein
MESKTTDEIKKRRAANTATYADKTKPTATHMPTNATSNFTVAPTTHPQPKK